MYLYFFREHNQLLDLKSIFGFVWPEPILLFASSEIIGSRTALHYTMSLQSNSEDLHSPFSWKRILPIVESPIQILYFRHSSMCEE